MITANQLRSIAPAMPAERANKYIAHLVEAMDEFEINTPLRAAAFLAQILHESGAFRWMEEIWGPTAAQRRYEPPGKKARDLGNTQPGDGHRFKGRGPIQLTGRANYARYGRELGVDLINNPPLAATPEVAFRIAGLYWRKNGLNELADKQWFKTITKRINGGFNGLADRVNYYNRAKLTLGARSMTRGGTQEISEDAEEDAPTNRFMRGLDEPGEITPRAAERNAGKKSAEEKTGAKKSSAKSSAATKKSSATTKKAAKRTNVRRATRRALCIGINDYPYEGNDLHGCVNDAHA